MLRVLEYGFEELIVRVRNNAVGVLRVSVRGLDFEPPRRNTRSRVYLIVLPHPASAPLVLAKSAERHGLFSCLARRCQLRLFRKETHSPEVE